MASALVAEYRFADYGNMTSTTTAPFSTAFGATGTATLTNSVDVEVQTLRGELVFKLGNP